jgi:non-specific serine/threonine protein kinase
MAWAQGDYKLAAERFEEELMIGREVGNNFATSYALQGLGRVAQFQGDYAAARSFYLEAIMLGQETRNSWVMALHLSALATLVVAQKQLEPPPLQLEGLRQAATLFGAAEMLIPSIRLEMSVPERAEHDQAITAARAALGEEAFSAAYEEGKKMTLDEAVAYALEER